MGREGEEHARGARVGGTRVEVDADAAPVAGRVDYVAAVDGCLRHEVAPEVGAHGGGVDGVCRFVVGGGRADRRQRVALVRVGAEGFGVGGGRVLDGGCFGRGKLE